MILAILGPSKSRLHLMHETICGPETLANDATLTRI